MRKSIADDVGAHLEGLLAVFFWILVYVLVFPAVAEIAFYGVEDDDAAFMYDAVAFRWFAVVLVDLGESIVEVVVAVVDGVGEGDLDELGFGEYLRNDGTHVFVHAIVVIDMPEAAADEPLAHVLGFFGVHDDIAMPGGVDEGVVEDIWAGGFYIDFFGAEVHAEIDIAEVGEVFYRCGIGVPVAATSVFEESEFHAGCLRHDGDTEREAV